MGSDRLSFGSFELPSFCALYHICSCKAFLRGQSGRPAAESAVAVAVEPAVAVAAEPAVAVVVAAAAAAAEQAVAVAAEPAVSEESSL